MSLLFYFIPIRVVVFALFIFFLFFFKRKTAYEGRISDWSSDVCSSDLIVARTDSLGAGLTKQIAYSKEEGDLGDQYNSFLDVEEVTDITTLRGDVVLARDVKLFRPKRLPSNLFQFRAGTGEDRVVLDCITSLQNGADLLWIETEKPHVEQIAGMVDRIREVVPNAKLVYNNSPSFNWTLNSSEEHTSELQSLMRISYAVFCLQKKNNILI